MNLLKKHRTIVLQMLSICAVLLMAHLLLKLLPGISGQIANFIIVLVWIIFLGTIIIFLALQIIQNFRLERSFIPGNLKIRPLPAHKKYRILNPLEGPGIFHKTQLHTHSSISYDSKVPPEQVIKSYQNDDYDILAITDHDKLSDLSAHSTDKMLILPGIEETVPVLFWPIPLGKHMVLINPVNRRPHTGSVQDRLDQAANSDSLVMPAHLSWRGGAGTGRWYPEEFYELKNLHFIEIENPHSRDPLDLTIWHKLIIKGGPEHPVWGVAVDDSHSGSNHSGWIMVKTTRLDLPSFITSMNKGAFYATTWPSALEITVERTKVLVHSPGAVWIRLFNAQNQVIMASRSEHTVYQSYGDEGFIRVEVSDRNGHTSWSQPMWLVAEG
jgi:hypothetical protein